jgi:hypothetical protein
MSILLSKDLLPSPKMTKKEKLKVMKARQSALSYATLTVLQQQGYQVSQSLKIPGAFGFHAKHNGKPTRIGIKTSADRWVGVPRNEAGEWGLLGAVDEVFVVTFNDRYAPKRLQVIAFDPQKIISMGEAVYAKAAKAEQSGLQWIPLDNHPNKHTTAMAAGPLLPHGKIIFDEEIEWTSGDDPEPDEATAEAAIPPASANGGATQPTPAPLRLTIPEAKAALALTFGIHPEAIKITVEG